MGQTWAVVAIGVSIGIAVLLLYWSSKTGAPPKKAAPKPAAKKEPEKKEAKKEPAEEPATPTPSPGSAKGKAEAAKGKAEAAKGKAEPAAAAEGPSSARARAPTMPEPAVQRRSVPVVNLAPGEDDDEITIVTLTPRADLAAAVAEGQALPDASGGDDDGDEDSDPGRAAAVPIIYDAEAAEDEPTRAHAVILVAAVGQTDLGQKRKINEDRYLAFDEHNLYVVADGMGGHAGGEVASQLAVDVISKAFAEQSFEGEPYENVPRRGSELALAIQMANRAIFERAKREPKLLGMGTTIVSARFTPGKERVYIGHVGDSRCYRFRAGQLTQITTDHTMGAIGMTGPFADHLSRAVGIAPAVKVDMVIAKPRHEDVFLLCSDGLSKMVKDDQIRDILAAHEDPNEAVDVLVKRANEKGGRDNITVIVVLVKDPTGFVQYIQAQQKKKRAEAETAEAPITIPPTEPTPAVATTGATPAAATTGATPAVRVSGEAAAVRVSGEAVAVRASGESVAVRASGEVAAARASKEVVVVDRKSTEPAATDRKSSEPKPVEPKS
jgi:serine/threonine protein phosphatase PrpC